jgi:hypothetical protein
MAYTSPGVLAFYITYALKSLNVLQVTQFEFPSSQEVPSAPKKRKFSEPKERYWAPRLLTTSSAVFTFTLLAKQTTLKDPKLYDVSDSASALNSAAE